jgi:hypothetical protein
LFWIKDRILEEPNFVTRASQGWQTSETEGVMHAVCYAVKKLVKRLPDAQQ